MKINLISALTIILFSLLAISCEEEETSTGQTSTQYQKFYGGAFTEEIAAVHILDDGSKIVLGTYLSNDMSVTSYYLFMTDPFGEITWSNQIGLENMAVASDMIVENNQIITVGHMTTSLGDQNILLWKTDMNGIHIDSLSLGSSDRNEVSPKIISSNDQSAYIIASHVINASDDIVNNVVYYISNQSYETEWEATYNVFSHNANVVGLKQVSDQDIIWVGSDIDNNNFEDNVISINLLNTFGAIINTTQIGLKNGLQEKAYSLKSDGDSYIIAGSTTNAEDIVMGMLIPFSFSTTVDIGEKISTEKSFDYELLDVTVTPDRNYYVTGYKQITADNQDIYISEWTRTGTPLWEQTYGGSGIDLGKLIDYHTPNDVISVHGTSDIATNQAITILQTDDEGSLVK